MTQSGFIDHAELRQWFERAQARLQQPSFYPLAGRFYQDVNERIRMELSTWRHAQDEIKHPLTPLLLKREAREKRSRSAKRLQVLVPARRYVQHLHRRVRLNESMFEPLKLTHFLAAKALTTTRLGLLFPLNDKQVFETYRVIAQITPIHREVARDLLAKHAEFFGTTTEELASLFKPSRQIPTEHALEYASRQSRRSAVFKKIIKAGILSPEELDLIS
jgi:hypothetical protein